MSWEQLSQIARYAGQLKSDENLAAPVACPNDGEVLQMGPDGKLYCPFDGWRPLR
jgi:hypothetical protein